jgi:YVTN family beta-propeller protein
VAVATNGDVWVLNSTQGNFSVFGTGGTEIFVGGTGGGAYAVAIEPVSGDAYIPVSFSGELLQYSSTGSLLNAFIGSGSSPSNSANGVAVASGGIVYVSTGASNTVSIFDSTGLTGSFTTASPTGVAVAPAGVNVGDVYVANFGGTVSQFSANGTPENVFAVGAQPFGVAVSNTGYVYVTNSAAGTVTVLGPDGSLINTITVGGNPRGIAVSNAGPNTGFIYVANGTSGTVTVINPDNRTVSAVITVGGTADGVAVAPTGSVNAGDVYVTNNAGNQIYQIGV